ncbi:MAG: BMP family ABC transporter substrate-binding protein [Oscillospiraceae bacterium]|nr:BMP family ABC transporter substrate-binding protein [Oscillospiraceae bacterium]
MKKLIALLLALVMVLGLAACGAPADDAKDTTAAAGNDTTAAADDTTAAAKADVKVGFIFLHTEQSTYDKNFIDAAIAACKELGVEMAQKTDIPESNACYEAAVELIEVEECDIIFADSFGHESFLLQAAKEYPDVEFCHATGTQAHTAGVANFHNAFASIYQGRYAAGVVAGLKLNEMIADGKIKAEEAKMGYVGAFTFAEVISGYTSFYLGAKSVCPTVTMDVKFTGSWYDEAKEKAAAEALIDGGCVLLSQHADSMGAPTACENAGVPNVSYNGSTAAACPNTFLVSSRINWIPYFKYMIEQVQKGEEIAADWTGTIETESVVLTDLGTAVAEGTQAELDKVIAGLKDGSINVFDTANFTIKGETVTSYTADVDTDDKFTPDTEVVENGIFQESKFRSAPYFDARIDGITLLDEAY